MNFVRGKTVLITGATDGIGKETAIQLARAGAKVVVHGRSREKVSRTADWILDQTGNRVLDTFVADFGSLDEVRHLAEEVCGKIGDLQILINNAGLFSNSLQFSRDGFELTFQVNFLAPFLLTLSLVELLRENKPSRVINVTSTLHIGADSHFTRIANGERYDGHEAYGSSKLALSLFTVELAERLKGSGVTVNHLHPGGVSTKLLREAFRSGGIPVEEGARVPVLLATDPGLQETSGVYYSRLKPASPDSRVFNHDLRDQLWHLAAEMVNFVGRESSSGEKAG